MSNVLPFTRTRATRGFGARSRVESLKRLRRDTKVHLELVDDSGRPRTRGECANGPRPCPWVGCSMNLFLDVTDANSLKLNFPDLEPDEVPAEKSCALDVADLGGATLENVADTMNVTRERVRQVEEKVISALRVRSRTRGSAAKVLSEFSDAPADAARGVRGSGSGSVFSGRVEGADVVDDVEDEPVTRISFFAEPDSERVDELVTADIWRMFARRQGIRSKQSIAQTKRREETDTMKKRGEMLARTETALRTFESRHGRAPSAKELFEVMGADGKSLENVRNAMRRLAQGRDGAPVPVVAKPKPSAASAPLPKPPRARSSDPTVATLISKRDDLRRKADALDAAIEALSVAL